jgi:serine/threonine protein kinase
MPVLLQLADFGFSKDRQQQSEAKTRVGTPAYLAPEVIVAEPGRSYDAQVSTKRWQRWGMAVSQAACETSAAKLGWLQFCAPANSAFSVACKSARPAPLLPARSVSTSGPAACCCM